MPGGKSMEMKTCKIGSYGLTFPFVLAPLAGISDRAFRYQCHRFGAGLTHTEMVSAKGLVHGNRKTRELLAVGEGEGPVGIQLFGSQPEIMAEAVASLEGSPAVLIDINMGCPVPKVVNNGEGAALLLDPARALALVQAARGATRLPLTVKMRVGYDQTPFDYCGFAAALEQAGCDALTVHGRTRAQYYTGRADRSKIAAIKRRVGIPVLGNGDVYRGQDALNLMEETGCDGVAVARGALGNPWIFQEIRALWQGEAAPAQPGPEEICQVMLDHLKGAVADKGPKVALREMRKHLAWYTKGMPKAAALRRAVNAADSIDALTAWIDQVRGCWREKCTDS